ncbi:hypothetical protein [Dialister succinatiphilus]
MSGTLSDSAMPLLPEAKQEGRLSCEIFHDYGLFISFASALGRGKSD